MIYWIDSDVLMQAQNRFYPPESFPQVWEFLDQKSIEGVVHMPDFVYGEIMKQQDWLSNWCKTRKHQNFCITTNEGVQAEYERVLAFVTQRYKNKSSAQLEKFAASADGWLIAHAIFSEGTVVSQEKAQTTKNNSIKIPTICDELDIKVMDFFQFLNETDFGK